MKALSFAIFLLGVSLITAGSGKWVTDNNLHSLHKSAILKFKPNHLLTYSHFPRVHQTHPPYSFACRTEGPAACF